MYLEANPPQNRAEGLIITKRGFRGMKGGEREKEDKRQEVRMGKDDFKCLSAHV